MLCGQNQESSKVGESQIAFPHIYFSITSTPLGTEFYETVTIFFHETRQEVTLLYGRLFLNYQQSSLVVVRYKFRTPPPTSLLIVESFGGY
jgi:hypothetical protein